MILHEIELIDGVHGYGINNSDMFPIFLAHGPAFKQAKRIESLDTVDLYPMMCHILDVEPAPNNGSLVNVADILAHYFNSKLFCKLRVIEVDI